MAGNLAELKELTDKLVQRDEELKKSEATMRAILNASPVGFMLADHRTIVWVNKILCETFGYSEEDLVGRKTDILYESKEEFDRVGKIVYDDETVRSGGAELVARVKHKDGYTFRCLLKVSYISPTKYVVIAVFVDLEKFKGYCDSYLKLRIPNGV